MLVTNVHIARHNPLGRGWAVLPKFLMNKHCIINVENADESCFLWAVLSALHPVRKNANRVQNYRHFVNELNAEGISFPLQPRDIWKFEALNDIGVNIYSYADVAGKRRYPLYISKTQNERTIDLLFFDNHYSWIKDFGRFMHDITEHQHRKHFCKRCFGHFTTS